MHRTWILPAVVAVSLAASPALGSEGQRYEDAVGDATGDSPDIAVVTVSEPEGDPTLRFEIQLAPGRPFGTDMETWSDTVFVLMSDEPTVDERGILVGGWTTGTHGVTLPIQEQSGAFLVTDEDMYYYVVDVDAAGPVLSFTFDRKLIDSPLDIYFQVLLGIERFDAAEGGEMEGDAYPDEGEPPAHYRVGASGW